MMVSRTHAPALLDTRKEPQKYFFPPVTWYIFYLKNKIQSFGRKKEALLW
jgi:hypothetical protein